METITIKVDQEVAKAYRESDSKKQEKINAIIKLFLQPEFANKSLSDVMAEIADKAQKRGLTPEILEDILNDEE
ncbi:hypothetical protein VB715_20205 [Crocosphaera sp. UHCC 0190]|uniref:hypothetical protein n=1 Tax=Crocosphaera sp. UHCC 0190 TaxID=3110246 RepID=UPI002B1F07DF|nr:hypothetical protein [Crocosphaera sp. UHCC 0190]MEA5512101.1 hypothetical protein [Crocosphaera sp. UHCC 0190]